MSTSSALITISCMIAASCSPPASVLILSWLVVVVVVGVVCCCCIPFQFALILVLTFAPCTLTCTPCAYGGCHWQQFTMAVFLPQPLAQFLLVVSHITTCTGGVLPSTHWHSYWTYTRATSTVWWWWWWWWWWCTWYIL